MKLRLKIVTPERVLLDEEVDSVSLPTKTGEITVLPNHLPLVSVLAAGEMTVRRDAHSWPMVVAGGVVEVTRGNVVTILADNAERVEEIDLKRAEEARARAQTLMTEKRHDAESYAFLAAKMEKELARLRVARKHRPGHGRI